MSGMRGRLERVEAALAGVGDVSARLRHRMARAAVLRRPLGPGHGRGRGGHRRRRDVGRALAPDALARRHGSRARRGRPRALRLRPRSHALRGRPARPLRPPARHARPPGEPASSPSTRTRCSPAPARASSTASRCWRTCSIRTNTRIRALPGAGSGSEAPQSRDPELVADAARPDSGERPRPPPRHAPRPEVEAPAVVGALEDVAEDLALDERVALVRAGVVERVQHAVDAQEDDLAVARLDDRAALGEQLGAGGSASARRPHCSMRPRLSRPVPLYLREADVEELLTPADAVEAVEACFARIARGAVENRPRYRLGLEGGRLHVMAAADLELGLAGLKTYAGFAEGARFVVALFAADGPSSSRSIDADRLGQLRTGAASAVAARHLARPGAGRSGSSAPAGRRRPSGVYAGRAARDRAGRRLLAQRSSGWRTSASGFGCEPGEYNRDAAEQDVVVTITTSRDPVLRGEWLRPGALVCAAGANRIEARELDNAVLERATLRLLRLARAGPDRGGRPRRAGRARCPRLARGPRAVGGRRRRDRRAASTTTTSSSSRASASRPRMSPSRALVYERARERGLGTEL